MITAKRIAIIELVLSALLPLAMPYVFSKEGYTLIVEGMAKMLFGTAYIYFASIAVCMLLGTACMSLGRYRSAASILVVPLLVGLFPYLLIYLTWMAWT